MTSAISQSRRTYPRAADRRRALERAAVRGERTQPAVQTDRFEPPSAARSTSTMPWFTSAPAEQSADRARLQELGIRPGAMTAPRRGLSDVTSERAPELLALDDESSLAAQAGQIVDDAYRRLLLRGPDPEGRHTHVELANAVLNDGGSPEDARAAVDASIKNSDEHAVIERVNRSFEDVLGRTPAAKGYWHDEALKWRAEGASLDDISGRLADAHKSSDEHLRSHPEDIVRGLYQDLLGREPDPQGLRTWSDKAGALMDEGKTPGEAREVIASDIRGSAEYQERQAAEGAASRPSDISSPDAPAWQNVNRWDQQVLDAVSQIEAETGVRVPPNLVKSMMRLESGGNAEAVTATGNPNGPYAIGLMQVVPGLSYGTYDEARLRADPTYQIYAGARDLVHRYQDPRNGHGWDGAIRGYFSGSYEPNTAEDVLGTSTNQYYDVINGWWNELGR